MDRARFQKQLDRQMVFLRSSCESYDNGNHEEAIRIATHLRTLIHNTRNSTSVLSHLGAMGVNINASPCHSPDAVLFGSTLSEIELKFHSDGESGTTYEVRQLPLGMQYLCRHIPLEQWLNEPIMRSLEGAFSRRDIILWAANKDGGAHVDAELPAMYAWLVDGTVSSTPAPEIPGFIGVHVDLQLGGRPPEGSESLPNAHFSDLRQMATEFMTTPDILSLMTGYTE